MNINESVSDLKKPEFDRQHVAKTLELLVLGV